VMPLLGPVVIRRCQFHSQWIVISFVCLNVGNGCVPLSLCICLCVYVNGGSVVEWLGRRTHNFRVEGSPPGHDTA